jgi:hypothetical protein
MATAADTRTYWLAVHGRPPRVWWLGGHLTVKTAGEAFPRYCAAANASCGSRTVAMSFRVAVGL